MKKQKKGISLIVLIITIIVMMILASAIIISLSNSNIITKAKEAVNTTNEKALQQQADLYAADLILEFREMGYGKLVIPDVAKEAYVNALKAGKTTEEAKQIANDSFIGIYEDWECSETMLFAKFSVYDPVYQEVLRVCELIWNENVTEVEELEIGKLAEIPQDLRECIIAEQKEYSKAMAEAGIDNSTHEAWVAYENFWGTNEPLKGLIEEDESNPYYYLTRALPIRIPRYVYNRDKTKIYDVAKCSEIHYSGGGIVETSAYDWEKVKKVIIDENFTILIAKIIPPVSADCEIILPDTLKIINKRAFANSRVTKIVIPSSVENIEFGAFSEVVSVAGAANRGNGAVLEELIIQKEKGSIPGEPWGLDTSKTTITWQP